MIDEAGSGHGSIGAEAPGGAYVRCGMYDVRFGKFARVARGRRRLAAPMYDVGCTMYDLEVPAGCKQPSFSGIFDALYGYEA